MNRLTNRRLAGLALLFNLPFAFFQFQRATFDADTHLFFADHYRRAWFSLWEPRWYLGFSTASYPPLVHQLIALLSWPLEAAISFFAPTGEAYAGAFAFAALEAAYALLLLAVLALLPAAMRSFARLFVGRPAAERAALLAVAVPAVSLAGWAFGQLPTLFATTVMLLAVARGAAYVRHGRPAHLVQAVLLAAVVAAAHHGVFLLAPFLGAAAAWRALAPAVSGAARGSLWQAARLKVAALRLGVWVLGSAAAVGLVLWPFLAWSAGQDLQTPIEHISRSNYLTDLAPWWFFFIPVYGPLLLAAPLALRADARRRRGLPPLAMLAAVLFVLGLGGTTRLPELLFGRGWEWLTYDRFALWAALCLLPFAALATLPRRQAGARAHSRRPTTGLLTLFGALLAWCIFSAWLSRLSSSQPPRLDLAPVVAFLNAPAQRPYRYFTLGFGDQMARLAALVANGTPDGNYHTARQLPELRASGLGALDGAVWSRFGVNAARPFLADPQRYGVRWALSFHRAYAPLLRETGWRFRFYSGAVGVWERAEVRPVSLSAPAWATGPASVWWGAAPLAALAGAAAALGARRARGWMRVPTRAEVVAGLGAARGGAFALTVILLFLWWMRIVWRGEIPLVFFAYQSVVVYAGDLAALAAVGLWLIEMRLRGQRLTWGPRGIAASGLLLVAAALASAAVSDQRWHTLATAAHLALTGGWYLMLVNDPPERAGLGRLLGALLFVQGLAAAGQVIAQSNAWLGPANLPWPPLLSAQVSGASVVQNAAGERWLRAYGTLAHPNILGGLLLLLGAGVIERWLATGRRRWLGLAALAAVVLVLTFSRAAWVGAGAAGAALAAAWAARRGLGWANLGGALSGVRAGHWRGLAGSRGLRVAAVCAAAAGLAALSLLPWLLVRAEMGTGAPHTEARSVNDRAQLTRTALQLIAAHPVLGVGAGRFVPAVARLNPPNIVLEPAHNLWLLITAETGPAGGLAAGALAASMAAVYWRRRRVAEPGEAVWGAALLGMLVIGGLDHYWWSLPPARLALALALGVWAAGASGPLTRPESRPEPSSARRAR